MVISACKINNSKYFFLIAYVTRHYRNIASFDQLTLETIIKYSKKIQMMNHNTGQKKLFQFSLKLSTYCRQQWSPKYDGVFRFSLHHTVFPLIYVKITKIPLISNLSLAIIPIIYFIQINFVPQIHIIGWTLVRYACL